MLLQTLIDLTPHCIDVKIVFENPRRRYYSESVSLSIGTRIIICSLYN